jgi:hypothetical protein
VKFFGKPLAAPFPDTCCIGEPKINSWRYTVNVKKPGGAGLARAGDNNQKL